MRLSLPDAAKAADHAGNNSDDDADGEVEDDGDDDDGEEEEEEDGDDDGEEDARVYDDVEYLGPLFTISSLCSEY